MNIGKKVRVTKQFKHGSHIIKKGDVGEIVKVRNPMTFQGQAVYTNYVAFRGYEHPVGVMADEIKEI